MLNGDYAFVMKNQDGELSDGLATCIFNRHGFLNVQDFLSKQDPFANHPTLSSWNVNLHTNHQMRIDSFYSSFDPNEFASWNNIWSAIWTMFLKLSTNEIVIANEINI